MNKLLRIALIFSIVLLSLASLSVVNAATSEEVIDHITSKFNVSADQKVQLERYLRNNPVSSQTADSIIAKVDEAATLMDKAGVTDPNKLSGAQKEEILSIAKDVASLAGAKLEYTSGGNVTVLSSEGEVVFSDDPNSAPTLTSGGTGDELDADEPKTGVIEVMPAVLVVLAIATVGLVIIAKKD